jgi:hypothetical protein
VPRPELDELQASLERDLGVLAEPFERHQLLAIRFHRASRLNGRASESETATWVRYFAEHFPHGYEHARLLWREWRKPLLKDETPGAGVAISHGQPHMHWRMTSHGLYLNLESLWADYVLSVEHFVGALDADDERCAVALERWHRLQWSVQQVTYAPPMPMALPAPVGYTASAASVSTSSSTLKGDERGDDVSG